METTQTSEVISLSRHPVMRQLAVTYVELQRAQGLGLIGESQFNPLTKAYLRFDGIDPRQINAAIVEAVHSYIR